MSTATKRPDPTGSLWNLFVDPPDSARPRAWWHWMDGNADPEGIRRDLAWLRGVGVRGVQMFDGGMGGPCVVPAPVRPGSEAWAEAVDVALRTAADLGLEFTVATSPGWSASGGPWVAPADAMKKVVWSETVIDGGTVDLDLPPLPDAAGPYQDAPRWGAADEVRWSLDTLTLAIPADPAHEPLVPTLTRTPHGDVDAAPLIDGGFAATLDLPRDPDAYSETWIEQDFGVPVTVSSVVVGLPGPRGFGAAPAPAATLVAVADDGTVTEVATLPATSVPVRTASFPPVTFRRFRLLLSGAAARDALPPIAEGVRLPPVLRAVSTFAVSEFALRGASRVHQAEVKAGFGVVADYFAVETDPASTLGTVDPEQIVDVTAHVTPSGRLRWDAPPGSWRILRLGASLTGQTNGPAPADSTGLEVDKLDGTRVSAYLEAYMSRTFGQASARIDGLLSDSIEAGAQNWTDAMVDRFRELRGYDPVPWLPALAGFVVGGPAESDRFLYDYRRTISELLAGEYYGTLAREAHERGMTYYAEALEDGRPQLGDDLAMRAHTDVPMGAMWTYDPDEGPRPTYVADLRGAASVAHVHGKSFVGSEAFTSFREPWTSTPATLKHVADLQLALGVTRFCIHTSPHQPESAPPPGIALAPFLGQTFSRNETWADMAEPWVGYLASCAALLAAGQPVASVAYFVGEEAPVTGLFNDEIDTAVPSGFGFDYIGPDALATVLSVEDGDIVSHGSRYRVLYLGGSTRRMTVEALRSVERLAVGGATIVGLRPESSPSLADDPHEFAAARARIWDAGRAAGRVIETTDLADALEGLGIEPTLAIAEGDVRSISRQVDDVTVHFVAHAGRAPRRLAATVADRGQRFELWDAVRRERRPVDATRSAGRASIELDLPASGSAFLVEVPATSDAETTVRGGPAETAVIPLSGVWTLRVPGHPEAEMTGGPRLWHDLDPSLAGFSGTASYTTVVDLRDEDLRGVTTVTLSCEDVADIARVFVNDAECGVLWTRPFLLDVTDHLAPGRNVVRIEVANAWRNRLIAEAAAPTGEIFAPMTQVFTPEAAIAPAGLGGAVTLTLARNQSKY